jgi:DnaK suppressor protein
MPAKKPIAKSSKSRKAVARPAARAATSRKAASRAKPAGVPRHPAPRTPASKATPPRRPAETELKRVAPMPAPPNPPIRVAPLPPAAAVATAEPADDADDNGLLAGPRNVQPYIAKRGEQYMSKEQLDHFRTILESWKRDLMVEVDRTVSHMKDEAANFPDPNDRATQEEEFSLELRTRDRERKLIRKIDEALKRIEDGSYGYCLETGEEIGIKRLEARPVATLSLEAQERRERRERQYGDRDDRYR